MANDRFRGRASRCTFLCGASAGIYLDELVVVAAVFAALRFETSRFEIPFGLRKLALGFAAPELGAVLFGERVRLAVLLHLARLSQVDDLGAHRSKSRKQKIQRVDKLISCAL